MRMTTDVSMVPGAIRPWPCPTLSSATFRAYNHTTPIAEPSRCNTSMRCRRVKTKSSGCCLMTVPRARSTAMHSWSC
eukprot:scaffold92283_cov75-Phaeocystis_antarctica.AAC.5